MTHGGGANTEQERNRQQPGRFAVSPVTNALPSLRSSRSLGPQRAAQGACRLARGHMCTSLGWYRSHWSNTPGSLDLRLGFHSSPCYRPGRPRRQNAPQISSSITNAVGFSKPGSQPRAQGAPGSTTERCPGDALAFFRQNIMKARGGRSQHTKAKVTETGKQTNKQGQVAIR